MPAKSQLGISRRQLLQALGLGAAAGPLLPLLNADAQTATRPKRLLLLYTPDGAPSYNNNIVDWRPTGTETNFTFHMIHAPLEPYKAKIVVPWGLTLTAGGAGEAHAHGMAGLWTATTLPAPNAGASFDGGNGRLTGWGAAPSLDQLVAQASGPNAPYQRALTDGTQETTYRSLALGVQCQGPNTLNRMTYKAANQPIHPEVNPRAAFDRIFANVRPTGTAAPTVDPNAAQRRAEQAALVDAVKGDLQGIRHRVGAADYQKIDAHLEGLLALERRVTAPPAAPAAASCTLGTQPGTNNDFPTQTTAMMDIVAHALACDVTRVMTLQLSYAFSHLRHTWLGHSSGHHDMSHEGRDRRTELQAIDNWYSKQVATLLQKLDSVNEGNGTLLDNTLIVWGRELGTTGHRLDRVPFVMMGKAGGALRTGRFLSYDREPHAKLLVSVAQLMGLEMNSIGNRVANSGPLTGLV